MKGNSTEQPPDRRPALLLALGFTISAVAVYASLWLLGAGTLGRLRSGAGVWPLAAAVLCLLLLVDSGALGTRSLSWRRQTSRDLERRFGTAPAALLWGLDAGLVVTTFRVTSLSWAALVLALLGLVPWWAGAAYALGFAVPVGTLILVAPRRADPTGMTDPEPGWVLQSIAGARAALKLVALLTLGGAAAVCVAAAAVALAR